MGMKKEIKNLICTPFDGDRILRAVEGDEYYDVVMVGGTSIEQRDAIAKQAHVLSGYFKFGDAAEIDYDYIIMGTSKDGIICKNNGEEVFGYSKPTLLNPPEEIVYDIHSSMGKIIEHDHHQTITHRYDWYILDQETLEVISIEEKKY